MTDSGNPKPSESFLKAQIKRLAAYHGYQDSKHELLRVLKTHAVSDEHAERIVTLILDTRRPNENGYLSCPAPAEMIDYAVLAPASPHKLKDPNPRCSLCGGYGWKITERNGISAAERCCCRCIE